LDTHTCRYGISLQVFNSISHEWVQRTSAKESWTTREIFHIYKQPCTCIILFIIIINILITMFSTIFWRDYTTFGRFPKILQKLSKAHTNVFRHFSKNFQRLLKISEGNQKLPKTFREDPKMLHTPTNLSTV